MEIYFIRHGQTDYNVNQIYIAGRSNQVNINEKGIIQSQKLANRLKKNEVKFDAAFEQLDEISGKCITPERDEGVEEIRRKLALATNEVINLDRVKIAELNQFRFDPVSLNRQMFNLMDNEK